MYRIKRLSDGLYSGGGQNPHFTKTGKVWTTLTGLKLHLNQFLPENAFYHNPWPPINWPAKNFPYNNCIVVEYGEPGECGCKEDVFNIKEYLVGKHKEELERWREADLKRQQYELELKALKAKYGY